MKAPVHIFLLLCKCWLLNASSSSPRVFHNQFALFIPHGAATADALAAKHGFLNLGQIGTLENYYLFEHPRLHRRSVEQANHTALLLTEPEVEWAEQMVESRRVKRDENR